MKAACKLRAWVLRTVVAYRCGRGGEARGGLNQQRKEEERRKQKVGGGMEAVRERKE